MEQMNYTYSHQTEPQGSVLAGALGAFAGALIGAAVWAAAFVALDIIAGIIGALIALLAIKGYDLMKGRPGKAKLVICIIAVLIGVFAGTAAGYAWDIHAIYVEETAQLGAFEKMFVLSEKEFYIQAIQDSAVQAEFAKNVGLGLLFAALCCYGMLRDIVAKPEEAAAMRAPVQDAAQPESADPGSPFDASL